MGQIRPAPHAALAALVFIAGANLRPAISAVGPLLESIGEETGAAPTLLGALGALPVFTFAAVSPFVHLLTRRWGMDRTVFAALTVLTLGTVLRSLGGETLQLFAGTLILSAAVAVLNVVLPAVVRRDFPDRVPVMTGAYTAVMTGVAAIASGTAVPLADALTWELALAASAAVSLIAALLWAPRLRSPAPDAAPQAPPDGADPAGPARRRSVWASPLAWGIMLFFGFQSAMFYFFLTWLAAIHTYHGFSPLIAGLGVSVYQATGIIAMLLVSRILQRSRDHRLVVGITGAGMAVGSLGMVLAPGLMLLWAVVSGFFSATSLLLALTMISMRADGPAQAGELSGMAQGVGYLIGGAAPLAAGYLFQSSGTWTLPLLLTLGVIAVYTCVGMWTGRDVGLFRERISRP